MSSKHITFYTIYGKAGTGKSTKLSEIIASKILNDEDYIVLTATHASLDNIYNICCTNNNGLNIDRSKFRTLYSFFKVNYVDNSLIGCDYVPETIVFDEFSLINKHLFKQILINIRCKAQFDCEIILTGDPLQLNSIYDNKEFISFNKIRKLNKIIDDYNVANKKNQTKQSLKLSVIEHFHLSIFGMKCIQSGKKELLKVNKRSKKSVNDLLNAIYNKKDINFNYNFIDINDVINKLLLDNHYFISSKYSIIQDVYDKLACRWNDKIVINQNIKFRVGLKRLYLYPGISITMIETSTEKNNKQPLYYNGEVLTFTGNIEYDQLKCMNKNNETIYIKKVKDIAGNEYYPVIPTKLMSIHKSQGLSLDNVIICIDCLFDMTMLYTAITRGRDNIYFYTKESDGVKQLFDSAFVDEFKELDLLVRLVS